MLSLLPSFNAQSGLNTGDGAPFPYEINLCLFKSFKLLGYPNFPNYFLVAVFSVYVVL